MPCNEHMHFILILKASSKYDIYKHERRNVPKLNKRALTLAIVSFYLHYHILKALTRNIPSGSV